MTAIPGALQQRQAKAKASIKSVLALALALNAAPFAIETKTIFASPLAAQAAEPPAKGPTTSKAAPASAPTSAATDQPAPAATAPHAKPTLGGENNPKQCPAYKLVGGGKLKHFDYALFSIEIPIESRIKHRSIKGFHLYRVFLGSQKVRLLVYAGEYPKFPLLKGEGLTVSRKKEEKKEYIEYKKDGKVVGSETLYKVPSHGHQATETRDCIVMYVHAVVPIGTPEEAAWGSKLVASIKPNEGFADYEDNVMEKMYRTQHSALELKESLDKAKAKAKTEPAQSNGQSPKGPEKKH